jgi:DNA-binding XRE family transcriptional regulator
MAKRRIPASASRTVTLLDLFCRKHNITTPQLATMANVSRQQTNEIRMGRSDTSIGTAKMLAKGASIIVQRKVAVGELFDLDYFVTL